MRRLIVPLLVPTVLLVAVACGDDDDAIETLPPIRTTTTTSTTTTTISTEPEFYVVQPGETLGIIAERMGVTVADIVALNEIDNPEYVQAGQRIQIPAGAVNIGPPPTTAPG